MTTEPKLEPLSAEELAELEEHVALHEEFKNNTYTGDTRKVRRLLETVKTLQVALRVQTELDGTAHHRIERDRLIAERAALAAELSDTRQLYYEVVSQRNAFAKRVKELEAPIKAEADVQRAKEKLGW